MSKHTPGPWKVGPTSNSDRISVYQDGPISVRIAVVRPSGTSPIAAEADAHLIAAAPELLEALKRAYADATTFLNEGDFKGKVEWDVSYIVDAIAKAEGRS